MGTIQCRNPRYYEEGLKQNNDGAALLMVVMNGRRIIITAEKNRRFEHYAVSR